MDSQGFRSIEERLIFMNLQSFRSLDGKNQLKFIYMFNIKFELLNSVGIFFVENIVMCYRVYVARLSYFH